MANFKVGDEVVCISAIAQEGTRWLPNAPKPSRGQKYIVSNISGPCVSLQGFEHNRKLPCDRCRATGCDWWHLEAWRFIKLDGLDTDTCMERDLVTNSMII